MKYLIYLSLAASFTSGCAHSDQLARAKKSSSPLVSSTPTAAEIVPTTPYPYSATVVSHVQPEAESTANRNVAFESSENGSDESESSPVVYADRVPLDGQGTESNRGSPAQNNGVELHPADRDTAGLDPVEQNGTSRREYNPTTPPVQATNQEGAPFGTLEPLEQLALSSNPTLRELEARVRSAHGRWLQVGLRPNPVASISAQELGNDGRAGQFGAFVGQEYVRGDKLNLNREAASWNLRRARQELAAQRMRVVTDVRRGFYLLLVAQERVKVALDLSEIAQQAVAKATELVKIQEPQRVLTQAEIEAELAFVMVENAESQRDAQWRSLAATVGQPDMTPQSVSGTLSANTPSLVWEEAMARIRAESPELAAAVSRVEELRWRVHRASAEATPNVTMQAGVYYDDASSDPFASFQLSLPLPIYNRNQGGVAEARANVSAATNAARRIELRLQNELSAVFQQYEQAHQQASRYESTILAKTKRNLDLSKQSYDIGQSSYLAVLTAQRSYTEAHLTWLNALERLWTATVQIDGLLLRDNLAQ